MEITPIGGGKYEMDGQTYDLGTLMMAIGIGQMETTEQQLVDQMEEMKKRKRMLDGLGKALSGIRGTDEGNFNANTFDTGVAKPDGSGNYTLKELMKELGMGDITGDIDNDWKWGKTERETAIEYIKTKMDSLNSQSQIDMIRTQHLTTLLDQITERTSNEVAKYDKSKETPIQHI